MSGAGEVIGINTAMIGAAQGICFAVGVDTAVFVATRLMRDGRIRRSRLGIAAQTVPILKRVSRFHGLAQESGILVTFVQPDSPAARAELAVGDTLIAFDGATLRSVDTLHAMLGGERAGHTAVLDLLRGAERRSLTILPETDD